MSLIKLIFFCVLSAPLSPYPVISTLNEKEDTLFRQMQQDISLYYKSGNRSSGPELLIFEYTPSSYENLFLLAAKLNLPYETIATLNNIENINFFSPESRILVPNIPGLFIPLENLDSEDEEKGVKIVINNSGQIRQLLFFPGRSLDPEARSDFLSPFLAPPLPELKITSNFGFRNHPVTGIYSFHPGIDLKSATGTQVKAACDGVIFESGCLENYGNYIIIKHKGFYSTIYGHLDKIFAQKGKEVHKGDIIGLSGNSGISTGPHLHFELRKKNTPVNPVNFLRK